MLPQPFEVTTLGTSNGFDPSGPCSSVLVQTNGRFLLTDAGPYVCDLLNHAGVSPNQIDAVVITHAHEDHAVGLSALLELNHRLRLFVTRETAAILRRKLAILNPGLSHPERLLDDAFDLALVEPERDYDFYGLRLRFHYTMHTIPCTGVELSMRDGNERRKVLVVGDHNSRANVEQAADDGVIDAARLEQLLALYTWQGDLLIADAGAGLIHGMPNDFGQTPARDLIFLHTPALKEQERHLFTLAKPGFRYAIIPEQRRPSPLERGLAHKAMSAAFPDASADWLNALLDAAQPLSVNRGHVVIRSHAQTQEVYVTLTGELEVLIDAGDDEARAVATVRAGELFGEMAAITGAPRSASVVARTPARLLCIPADLFTRFAAESELAARLPEVWRKRTSLQTVGFLSDSSVSTRMRLARHAVRRSIQPGATLIREGSKSNAVFVLVQGRVQVYKGEEPLLVDGAPIIVNPGTLIGETAPFLRKARNASIVTLDECEVLAIPGADFKRIISDSPQLYCSISHMVRERAAA